jgi:hypothetical protein
LGHAYGLGRSVGRHLEHRGRTRLHQASATGSSTTVEKTPLRPGDTGQLFRRLLPPSTTVTPIALDHWPRRNPVESGVEACCSRYLTTLE